MVQRLVGRRLGVNHQATTPTSCLGHFECARGACRRILAPCMLASCWRRPMARISPRSWPCRRSSTGASPAGPASACASASMAAMSWASWPCRGAPCMGAWRAPRAQPCWPRGGRRTRRRGLAPLRSSWGWCDAWRTAPCSISHQAGPRRVSLSSCRLGGLREPLPAAAAAPCFEGLGTSADLL